MTPKTAYIPSLDGVRCIAVCLVIFYHGSYGICVGGWVGVDLFFVLSGYLITSLLHTEDETSGRIDFLKFYARRALRLFPPLVLGVCLANLVWSYTRPLPEANALVATFASLFYFANLVPGAILGPLGHLWSLAVEEHFYLFWPILVSAFFFRVRLRRGAGWLLALVVVIEIARAIAYRVGILQLSANSIWTIDPYRFSLFRMDAILMGALLAILFSRGYVREISLVDSPILLGMTLGLFLAVFFLLDEHNKYWRAGGFVATNLLCVALVAIAVKNPNQALLSHKALRWIGRRSYGIYVYHFPIFTALEFLRREHSSSNFLAVSFLRFAVTFLAAELSFRFVEQPILRFKKRFEVVPVTVPATP